MGGPSGTDKTRLRPGPPPPSGGPLPPGPPALLDVGMSVGEYQLDALLGEGGMGTVYAAHQPLIGKRVAIKVLKGGLSSDPGLVRRFVDEARAVNKIGHPNIIDIFSFGQLADGRQYFVMELLEGETLAARIERGTLEATEARRFFGQTLSALEAAHREKIVHRDLKPENLWISTPRHGAPYVKVLDFGIAKLLEKDTVNVTQTGVAMGTPFYMSPEQCLGHNVDHRTDIYALGVMLYQVCAGRLPFEGRTFAEVVTQQITAAPAPPSTWRAIAPALEQLILSCLEKDPARRPQSAEELRQRLDAALDDRAPPSAAPAIEPAVSVTARRRLALVGALIVAAAGLALIRPMLGPAPGATAAAPPPPKTTPVPTAAAPVPEKAATVPTAATPKDPVASNSAVALSRSAPSRPRSRTRPAPAAHRLKRAAADDLGIERDNPFRPKKTKK